MTLVWFGGLALSGLYSVATTGKKKLSKGLIGNRGVLWWML